MASEDPRRLGLKRRVSCGLSNPRHFYAPPRGRRNVDEALRMFPHTARYCPIGYPIGRQHSYLRTVQFVAHPNTSDGSSHFCSTLHVAMQIGLYHPREVGVRRIVSEDSGEATFVTLRQAHISRVSRTNVVNVAQPVNDKWFVVLDKDIGTPCQEKISGLPLVRSTIINRRSLYEAEISASYQPPFRPFLLIACTERIVTACLTPERQGSGEYRRILRFPSI